MTGLGVIALVVVAVWLTVMSVLVLLCVRQISALMIRVDLTARGASGIVATTIGFRLSAALAERAPFLTEGPKLVILLSTTCDPCLDLIAELRRGTTPANLGPENRVILLRTQGDPAADVVIHELEPFARVIAGDAAEDVARGLGMNTTPTAVLLDDGEVTGTGVAHRVAELDELTRDIGRAPGQTLTLKEPVNA